MTMFRRSGARSRESRTAVVQRDSLQQQMYLKVLQA